MIPFLEITIRLLTTADRRQDGTPYEARFGSRPTHPDWLGRAVPDQERVPGHPSVGRDIALLAGVADPMGRLAATGNFVFGDEFEAAAAVRHIRGRMDSGGAGVRDRRERA